MDHRLEFREVQLECRPRAFHQCGEPLRQRHHALPIIQLPGAEACRRLRKIQALYRVAELHFRADPLDGIARQRRCNSRYPQLFGSRRGDFAAIGCKRPEHRISRITNRHAPAGAQAVAQNKVARRCESVVRGYVVDDDGLIAKCRGTACSDVRPDFQTV